MGEVISLQDYKVRREKEQEDEIERLRAELEDLMEEIGFNTIPEALIQMAAVSDTESPGYLGLNIPLHVPAYYPYYLSGEEMIIDEYKEGDS